MNPVNCVMHLQRPPFFAAGPEKRSKTYQRGFQKWISFPIWRPSPATKKIPRLHKTPLIRKRRLKVMSLTRCRCWHISLLLDFRNKVCSVQLFNQNTKKQKCQTKNQGESTSNQGFTVMQKHQQMLKSPKPWGALWINQKLLIWERRKKVGMQTLQRNSDSSDSSIHIDPKFRSKVDYFGWGFRIMKTSKHYHSRHDMVQSRPSIFKLAMLTILPFDSKEPSVLLWWVLGLANS